MPEANLAAPSRPGSVSLHMGAQVRDFDSIAAALEAAADGDRITLSAGTYAESLVVSKAVEIAGVGNSDEVLIEGPGDTVEIKVEGVALRNLAVRCTSTPVASDASEYCAVYVSSGSASIENCIVSAPNHSGIGVEGEGTRATITHTATRNTDRYGMVVWNGARVSISDCEMIGGRRKGLTVARCRCEPAGQRCGRCAQLRDRRLPQLGSGCK